MLSNFYIKNKVLLFIILAITFSFLYVINPACSQIPDIEYHPYQNWNDYLQNPDMNTYQQYTDESDVYYKHGLDFLNSNQYTKAIDSFEKALNIAPDRINTRNNLAVTYINRGTYYFNQEKNLEKLQMIIETPFSF